MAEETRKELESEVIYSLFVRNHSEPGTFEALRADLPRIRSLGVDTIWLMPIHPCGIKNRKGEDGSPYAIADYRTVDPAMGSLKQFKELVDDIHALGMKIIIDVVYNHTSLDSRLLAEHPEWFYRDDNGDVGSLVADWSDIADLDYHNKGLWKYQIDTLKQWSKLVDGFRCDVASRVPLEFWKKARKVTEKVNPDLMWLAESVHLPFLNMCRDAGRDAVCDARLYEAFDICYDYDVFPVMEAYLRKEVPLSRWMEELQMQEARFPKNYIKLRYLENHDTDRFAKDEQSFDLWKNWTAMQFFMKGSPLIYEGQEQRNSHRPDFFTADPIEWKDDARSKEAQKFMARMAQIHHELPCNAPVRYTAYDDLDTAVIQRGGMTGLFTLMDPPKEVPVELADGTYTNLIDDKPVKVRHGKICGSKLPVIVKDDEHE